MYSLPAATAAVTSETISSTKFNTLTEDLESDANTARPIVAGGTGATSASAARTNLGLAPIEPLLTDPAADRITFWDDSASAFGYLTLGTGLSITTTVLSLDADLSTLAGLTVAADNFIAGNAGGTAWEVKTPANARTSLGLVIGTNVQAWDADLDTYAANPLTSGELGQLQNIGTTTISAAQWGYLGAAGGTLWTSANDGAGSGLDADTLDGVQASAFAALAGADFTGGITTAANSRSSFGSSAVTDHWASITSLEIYINGTSPGLMISSQGSNRAHISTGYRNNSAGWTALGGATGGAMLSFGADGTIYIQQDASVSGISPTLHHTFSPDGSVDLGGAVTAESIVAPAPQLNTATGTLVPATHANRILRMTGNITLDSGWTEGDIVILDPNGTARTITRGTASAMFVNGANAATATTDTRGTVAIRWSYTNVCYLEGAVS